jgi:hypothetical protein
MNDTLGLMFLGHPFHSVSLARRVIYRHFIADTADSIDSPIAVTFEFSSRRCATRTAPASTVVLRASSVDRKAFDYDTEAIALLTSYQAINYSETWTFITRSLAAFPTICHVSFAAPFPRLWLDTMDSLDGHDTM